MALTRALLYAPEPSLADEPTGQLDSATSQEIMRLFAQVNEAGAQRPGRVIRLVDGRLVDGRLVDGRLVDGRPSA
ncbi:MAG: hypothetical protein A2051_05875 [Desulfovibrionales bacterium GWA2_65_9]|nr:MAG: hypothetical protein A2051_05875 [Desulfovibrionales bacterium GWA2_65_9]